MFGVSSPRMRTERFGKMLSDIPRGWERNTGDLGANKVILTVTSNTSSTANVRPPLFFAMLTRQGRATSPHSCFTGGKTEAVEL